MAPRDTFPYLPALTIMICMTNFVVIIYSVYPYAAFMAVSLGAVRNLDDAGYYSGFLESAFVFGSLLASKSWGRLADRSGRLPVLYVGLSSSCILSVVLGFSTNFWGACLSRFVMGLLNNVNVMAKTLVSEVCRKEHEVVGMGAITTGFSLGLLIGPGVGGVLADPAATWPSVFSESGLFGRYPCLLPNLVVAGLALLSMSLVFLFLEETPPSRRRGRQPRRSTENGDSVSGAQAADDAISSPSRSSRFADDDGSGREMHSKERKPDNLSANPHVVTLVSLNGIFSFVFSGFDALIPLWAVTSRARKGLAWTTHDIGVMLMACALTLMAFEFVAVPCITKRLGIKRSQRVGSMIEVPTYLVMPMISTLKLTGERLVVCTFVLLFMVYCCSNSFYLAISLALNNASNGHRAAEVNSVANISGSLGQTLGPLVISPLFAFSTRGRHPFPFDYHLVFYILAIMRGVVAVVGWTSVDQAPPAQTRSVTESEASETGSGEGGEESRHNRRGVDEEDCSKPKVRRLNRKADQYGTFAASLKSPTNG